MNHLPSLKCKELTLIFNNRTNIEKRKRFRAKSWKVDSVSVEKGEVGDKVGVEEREREDWWRSEAKSNIIPCCRNNKDLIIQNILLNWVFSLRMGSVSYRQQFL